MNVHREIRIARTQIEGVLLALQHTLGEDEQLKLDMLEGETAFHDIIRQLLAANEDDEGVIAALARQIEDRSTRSERFVNRIEARKKAIASLMDCAGLTSLPLPEATLSLRTLKPRPKVVDADALPTAFVIIKEVRKPDTDAIKVAVEGGASIPGVIMTNGQASLQIRRK